MNDSSTRDSVRRKNAREQLTRIDERLFQSAHLPDFATKEEAKEKLIDKGAGTHAFFCARVDSLIESLHMVLLADFVASFFAFTLSLMFDVSSVRALSIWLAGVLSVTGIRYFILKNIRSSHNEQSHEASYQFLIIGCLISGLCWGLIPLALPATSPPALSVLSALWLAGMLSGAAIALSVMRVVFFAFALAASVSFVLTALYHFENNQLEVVLSFLIFLAFNCLIALRARSQTGSQVLATLRNAELEARLNAEAERLAAANEELKIQRRRQAALEAQKATSDSKLLAAAEERNLLLNSLQEGIFGISELGAITFINKSALHMLEYEEDELIGIAVPSLLNPIEEGGLSDHNNQGMVRTYRDGIASNLIDSQFRTKSNHQLPVHYSAEPVVKDSKSIGAVVSFTDLSKLKEMENMLLQSRKMEAIGRLTGGVAHDFNNLLTVILGNLQFLERNLQASKKESELIAKITAAAQSGAELNNRLLSFSREQSLHTSNVDVSELIVEMQEFFSRILGEDIDLVCLDSEQECIAATDRLQLENAILNLCINAKDAMSFGGTVTLSARPVPKPPSILSNVVSQSSTEAPYIELSVADNGTGMPKEIAQKIFEPFFTTKSKGRGTGLGLSTVYGFLNQSGGDITVESELGVGPRLSSISRRRRTIWPIFKRRRSKTMAPYGSLALCLLWKTMTMCATSRYRF
jgi:PAS domain S-box-containing protein